LATHSIGDFPTFLIFPENVKFLFSEKSARRPKKKGFPPPAYRVNPAQKKESPSWGSQAMGIPQKKYRTTTCIFKNLLN
jgi:hypothetical protein